MQSDAIWWKVIVHANCDQRQNLPKFIIFSLETTTSLRQGFYDQGTFWSSLLDELKNFVAKIFLKLVC